LWRAADDLSAIAGIVAARIHFKLLNFEKLRLNLVSDESGMRISKEEQNSKPTEIENFDF
jgi:hypothetical protein